jgi:anti-sigma factor RsiW
MHADFDPMNDIRTALRALPGFTPPAGAWAGAQARLAQREAGTPAMPARLAMAASLVVMLAAGLLWGGMPQGVTSPDRPAPLGAPIKDLVAENARLEAVLSGLPQPSTTRVGTAYAVAALEDRLAMIDDRLTAVSLQPAAPETTEELWRQRVNLMNSLVQVQYANLVASR